VKIVIKAEVDCDFKSITLAAKKIQSPTSKSKKLVEAKFISR